MIIKDLRTFALSIPWRDPISAGLRMNPNREILVVEVETASGLVGMGFMQPLRGGLRTIAMCVEEMIKPLIMGRDASHVEGLWNEMYRATYWQGLWTGFLVAGVIGIAGLIWVAKS